MPDCCPAAWCPSPSAMPERDVKKWTANSAPRKHKMILLNTKRPFLWIHVEVVDIPICCMNRIHTDSIYFSFDWLPYPEKSCGSESKNRTKPNQNHSQVEGVLNQRNSPILWHHLPYTSFLYGKERF